MRSPLPLASRRGRILAVTAAVLVVIVILGSYAVSLAADWFWYGEVGFRSVFTTVLWTRVGLFAAAAAFMGAFVAANLALAFRLRPSYRPMSLEQQNLDRYRFVFTPRIRLFITVASGVCAFIAGTTAQGQWQTWLLFANSTPFGQTDPQFHKDVSFYMFEYPFYRYLLGVGFAAVVLAGLGSLFLHWLYGGVRLQGTGDRMTDRSRAHLWGLLGLFLALKAAAYYLDRYGLVFAHSDITKVDGASYADVHYLLPAKNILMFVAAMAVLVFVFSIVRRNLLPSTVMLALLGLSAVLIGGVFPFAAEQISVKPNAAAKEAPFIGRNITATRQGYGIAGAEESSYNLKTTATAEELQNDTATLPHARLLDPTVLPPTFTQLQQVRGFYGFTPKLDVDRYSVNGRIQDYVVGVRELAQGELSGTQTNWINQHTVFTHGFGFVAAPANTITATGEPCFASGSLESNGKAPVCSDGSINVTQPRIYYGELFGDEYAVVGKTAGQPDVELDRPSASASDTSDPTAQGTKNTYDGKGGVAVGSPLRRFIYSVYFRERNFLLSSSIQPTSKVLYVRDPRDRVTKVAPFLTLDGDPYPAVVNGKVVWILDGYTTSNAYPYSQRETLGDAAADSLSGTGTARQPRESVNYIRNSVKATVDAYDGTVSLYEWDTDDAVLKTWNKAFGGIIKPRSAISPELQAHFRYPEDLFKVQRRMIAQYHVSDPRDFFNSQDFWTVPGDPTASAGNMGPQPPYYLVGQFPGESTSTFQLTTALTANKRENLAAIVTASYRDDGSTSLKVLRLPAESATAILGPNQVQNNFRADPSISKDISLLGTGQSSVEYGNLLTLPVGGGLLYLEPLYVRGAGDTGYPKLQRVLAAFGNKIAYEPTLSQAIQTLFSPDSTTIKVPGSGSGGTSGSGGGGAASAGTAKAVADITAALDALKKAQQAGDFAAIGRAQADLAAAVKEFDAAQKAATAKPSPSPSATPSGGPSGSPGASPSASPSG